jgi:hypothetical protein
MDFTEVNNVKTVSTNIGTSVRTYTCYTENDATFTERDVSLTQSDASLTQRDASSFSSTVSSSSNDANFVGNSTIYYYLETPFHSAFAHWVYECAIYYLDLPKDANVIVIKNPERKYKSLFLTAMNIRPEQIYYIEEETSEFPSPNKCFISQKTCWNDQGRTHITEYRECVLKFLDYFNKKTREYTMEKNNLQGDSKECWDKTIEILFLPRNTIQNYACNDRIVDYKPIMEKLKGKNYLVYDTMTTDNILFQIELLKKSKNIYLDYGSSFFVNGLFCEGSVIYVIGKHYNVFELYPYSHETLKIIQERNEVIFL